MIVKTNFPDYLMHYGVSIKDGAPGVGTGNWRRGNVTSKVVEYPDGGYGYKYIAKDGSEHDTKIGAHVKNGVNSVKQAFAKVKSVDNPMAQKELQSKSFKLARALLNVDKNSPSRKEIDKLIEIGRRADDLDDQRGDFVMEYLDNDNQVMEDAQKEADEANRSEDGYGHDWEAEDFADTDYAAGVMFDKYETKRNPKIVDLDNKIKEVDKEFKNQLIVALQSNVGNLKKELNTFRPGETGSKQFDRDFVLATRLEIASRASSEKRMQEVEEKRVKEAEDIVNKYTSKNNTPAQSIPKNEVKNTAKLFVEDIRKHQLSKDGAYNEILYDYAKNLKYQGNYSESLGEIENMLVDMVNKELKRK